MNPNPICMTCRHRNDTNVDNTLRQIEQRVRGIEETDRSREAGRGVAFLWDIHARCPYGMYCNTMEQYRQANMRAARGLEEKLIAVAVEGEPGMYHDVLRLMQGHYPAAYRTLERLRARYYQKEVEDER